VAWNASPRNGNNDIENNNNTNLPIVVATLLPPPPNIYQELSGLPHTTTTTIDRLPHAHDGSLSFTVKETTHYPNGYRQLKIEHYFIPSDRTRSVSEALDNGCMPSSAYLTMMGEHTTLPPDMPQIVLRSDLPTSDIDDANNVRATAATTTPTTITTTSTTTELTNPSGSTAVEATTTKSQRKRGGRGMFQVCGICWCSACTLCLGITVMIVIGIVTVVIIRPWE
jgi:hypothetical protein